MKTTMPIGAVTTRTRHYRSCKDVCSRINGATVGTTAHEFHMAAALSARTRAKARRGQGAITVSGLITLCATICRR
jgi:hypothetical protein